jgi:uncharacterized protein
MLCFDIRSLETHAESVDGLLEAVDPIWEADDTRPVGTGIAVRGRLSGAGHGRFYFTGTLEGSVVGECRRCLGEAQFTVADELQLVFVDATLDGADDDDVILIPAGARELDLRPALREEWLLSVPSFVLCREDCQGLCPTCGSDRNTGACSCAPTPDARWAGLNALRSSGS